MKTNVVNNNSFKGKVKFSKKLSKPMIDYANRILDAPFSGTTARERIARASYDVEIYGRFSKKTINPKIFFSSTFKQLRDPKALYYVSSSTYCCPERGVSINSPVAIGANKLNNHITLFEQYKNTHYYTYNTFGEKVRAFFNRMFGIRK